MITFGIYLPWFTVKLRRYIIGNVRFGNIEFEYNGNGSDLFIIFLKGYFLTIITLGIYSFWFAKDLINYYIDNIALVQDGRTTRLQSMVTGGGYFGLVIGNIFIILLSLGIAAPWATVRTLNFLFNNIIIEGDLDLDALSQTEQAYLDATGEDVTDMLDIGIV